MGLDKVDLEKRFGRSPIEAFSQIRPSWDLTQAAKDGNDVRPEILSKTVLFEATPAAFISACRCPEHYDFAERYSQGSLRNILRVAGLWHRGDSLSPPVFGLLEDGTIMKQDGHHRTSVALFTRHSPILFYAPEAAGHNPALLRVDRINPSFSSDVVQKNRSS